jgi:hypothetical protein
MAKEKETAPKFSATIAYSKLPVAGVPLYGDKKAEPTLEEMLDELEKSDVQSARKDALLAKLREREAIARKQVEPNPKRYTVDPETGKIDIDEEEGEYTQKEAMMVSASIKGKSGQYDAAIALITAAKELVSDNRANVTEKPKEFLVDPETGVITHDPENGEYTLSEARTISQSLQKGKQETQTPREQKSFLEKLDEVTEGLVSKRIASMFGGGDGQSQAMADPVDEFFHRLDQVEEVKQRFGNPGGGSAQALAQSGIRGELMKLLLEDERDRLKMQYEHETQVERNKHLGVLATTVKDNLGDGIQALRAAAAEFKESTGAAQKEAPQAYECGQCHARFTVPPGVNASQVGCPNCGTVYTKEQLEGV